MDIELIFRLSSEHLREVTALTSHADTGVPPQHVRTVAGAVFPGVAGGLSAGRAHVDVFRAGAHTASGGALREAILARDGGNVGEKAVTTHVIAVPARNDA